jgi:pyruvate dehydrogenase E1 component alpha subunit
VEAVYRAALEAVERARSGGGPTFIEAKTYRLNGHMYGDSETYRTKEEVASWWEKEPIKRLGEKLIANGQATVDELDALNREIMEEVAAAAEFARQSPEPGFEEIFSDVI